MRAKLFLCFLVYVSVTVAESPAAKELVPVTKPYYFEVECVGGKTISHCAVGVSGPDFSGAAVTIAGNGRSCLVPEDLLAKASGASSKKTVQLAKFTGKDVYERGLTKDKAWVFDGYPVAAYYSCEDEKTGAVTQNAFCVAPLRLDELVHKSETARDLIVYKRDPNPKEIVDNTTEVQCGGMSTALNNAISVQQPSKLFRLKDQEEALKPHLKISQNETKRHKTNSSADQANKGEATKKE